jgi:alkyl hydroperoxide reductase subunit AhpC
VSHQAEFEAANTNVVTISFGTEYWTKVWLQETKSPFPFLMDSEKVSYRAYDLESSTLRSWSPATVWYYTKARLQGRDIPPSRGDAHQLGGDFIIDPQGIIRLSHPSADPTDRPGMAAIFASLR